MEVNDVDKWMSQVQGAVIAMQNLLSLGDLNEITSMMYPDLSDWMWSDYEIEQIIERKIWSIK
jgi:O-phosphoseryl-tRNA(Cys) synthetase